MIKFKKFLAVAMTGAMMLGIVATATPVVAVYADNSEDGDTTDPTCTIDISEGVNYEKFQITVTPEATDKIVFLEVLKANDKDAKVSGTYGFPVGTEDGDVTIDLSFLKATKQQFIRFYGANGIRSAIVPVNAQPTKLSVKYQTPTATNPAIKDYFTGKNFDATKLGNYQYKGLYSSAWLEMEDLTVADLNNFAVTGLTLLIREKFDEGTTKPENAHPVGAEAKVKIPAAPKAPKVSFDYAKGIISVGKNTELSTDMSTWTDVKDAKLSISDFRTNISTTTTGANDVTVYVRTKAKGKKAPSSVTLVTIPADKTFAGATPTFTPEAGTNVLSGSIAMADKADQKITASTVVDDKKNTVTAVFKAEGANFDYSLDGGKTWKTVKAGKTFSVDQTRQFDLTVRRSGDKGEELLPSESVTISISAYVAPVADDDEGNGGGENENGGGENENGGGENENGGGENENGGGENENGGGV